MTACKVLFNIYQKCSPARRLNLLLICVVCETLYKTQIPSINSFTIDQTYMLFVDSKTQYNISEAIISTA